MTLPEFVHSALSILADVPDPAPADPTDGSNGLSLLLSYVKYGALVACGIAALVSGGMLAVGALSHHPDNVDRGKRALIWSLGGVIVCALAIGVVNSVFDAATTG